MNKIAFGILMFAAFAMLAVPAGAQEVYFVPQHSSADYGNTTEVQIWVSATGLKTGQINLTYDPTCANVTNYVKNTTNFPMSGWTHHDGSEWITFMTLETSISGNYEIGTLTIRGANEEDCTTALEFNVTDPSEYCELSDGYGIVISATWKDGTFTCGDTTGVKGDFDGDADIDFDDFVEFAGAYGATTCADSNYNSIADFDDDCDVDFDDFVEFAGVYTG